MTSYNYSDMKTLHVSLGERSYPIYIGHHLLHDSSLITPHIHGQQVMIVTNNTVAHHYLDTLKNSLSKTHECDTLILEDGEQFKHIDSVMTIIDALLAHTHTRSTTLIALGGGVIGDMTGFAAACYQRGVAFIQIPTSLLAQVDASVGGKTGVNHARGKNMMGAFHQPSAVIIDIHVLNTLNERHYHAGLAEIIKHALIQDKDFFSLLETEMPRLLKRDPLLLIDVLYRSCCIKARIVEADETEKTGLRALLNFGHTFAHAIETALQYETLLHGEAVAIGMVMAARLSHDTLSELDLHRIINLIKAAQLPVSLPDTLNTHTLLQLMRHDKKNEDTDKLRFVLLKAIGQAMLVDKPNCEKDIFI